ncbi:MAG: penicillin-binding protein 2 [Candidatus Woykebacteria bacterium GWB1_45_5]|uniref:Penicillin-binding protein 2 n=1 Tax=Candidatus Woykebacteria bacterium GWB1_45_5 TaxID=1802592 RepID=A0A1G1W9R7_9BACT|nr:MAG: penicillin-binding protein 2 [Candidatus Woykebacteria bacterium GWB1_45_5]
MSKLKRKFGFAFPEFVQLGKKRKNLPDWQQVRVAESWEGKGLFESVAGKPSRLSTARVATIYFVFFSCFLVLLARAFDLQVIQGNIFLGEAEGNRLRLEINHAPRGVIFDRGGKILAQNTPGFRLLLDPQRLPADKKQAVIAKLAFILKVPNSFLAERLRNAKGEITLVNDLEPDKALLVEAESKNLAGVELEVSPIRYYSYKEITAHILGYTAEASKEDLAQKLTIPYVLGDKVGKAGVEASQEGILRGVNGYKLIKVTAEGENKGDIYQSDPHPGQNSTLSIDIDLQQFVYQALQKKIVEVGAKKASAVVLDPYTGEVLAMISLPSFDNNLFAKEITEQKYQQLISNPDNLLLNRADGAAYPPGSTFKMITATAGLETGAISAETKLVDPGFIILGNQVFENWLWRESHKTEGSINVVQALVRSTNTFFYRVGQMVGEKTIVKYANLLGLGQKTGIELPGETAGLIPTQSWKLATKGEPWYPGETLSMSIGQGDVLVSPLQLSIVTATFANGGRLVTPTILKTGEPKVVRENFLKKETLGTVREGLYQVVTGPSGLTWVFGNLKIPSAGKTGSAESGGERAHAWYTAFAPYPNPKIVVTVQVENAGHGSEVSAPVVKQIFEWWFTRQQR